MKRIFALLLSVGIMLLAFSVCTYAADQTSLVAGGASKIASINTSPGVYPYAEIDREDPEANLCRITVTFRDNNNASVYEHAGDMVSFFIKSSRDTEIGWVDKNDSGDLENGEEFDSNALASNSGCHVVNARLSRAGSVVFYVGSRVTGTFDITVYTDRNGEPGVAIGRSTAEVRRAEKPLSLVTTDESGKYNIGGHTGDINDPFELPVDLDIGLKALVQESAEGQDVIFKCSYNGGPEENVGSETVDEDGEAFLEYETEKVGLYVFRAYLGGQASNSECISFIAGEADEVAAKTPDGSKLAVKEEAAVEFYLLDEYGNTIANDPVTNVIFDVFDAPSGSMYRDYTGETGVVDENGIAVFSFTPDRVGEYTIRCKIAGANASETIDVEAVKMDKTAALGFVLKEGNTTVPVLRYVDANKDGEPEIAGKLQVTLIDAAGVKTVAKGEALRNLLFSTTDAAKATIDTNGLITVTDRNFSGTVPLKVIDTVSNITATYDLPIAGAPATLRQTSAVTGKKARVMLQYLDKSGNVTYSVEGEDYSIAASPKKVSILDKKKFDSGGRAEFAVIAEDYGTYDITVITGNQRVSQSFRLEFAPAPPPRQIIGAKSVIMRIGVNSYTQDGMLKTSDVAPFIKDGRTFVALRPLGEAFGAVINWDPVTRVATLTREDMTLRITIDGSVIQKISGGATTNIPVDVPAFIEAGRTVLPFRAVGEAFGVQVDYQAESRIVSYTQG